MTKFIATLNQNIKIEAENADEGFEKLKEKLEDLYPSDFTLIEVKE